MDDKMGHYVVGNGGRVSTAVYSGPTSQAIGINGGASLDFDGPSIYKVQVLGNIYSPRRAVHGASASNFRADMLNARDRRRRGEYVRPFDHQVPVFLSTRFMSRSPFFRTFLRSP